MNHSVCLCFVHLDVGVLNVGEVAEGGEHAHPAQDAREAVSQGNDHYIAAHNMYVCISTNRYIIAAFIILITERPQKCFFQPCVM